MVVHTLLFVLYSTVYILLPSVILLKKTGMRFKDNSFCHTVLLSYFLGLGLLIAEYWICSLVKAFWLFAAISPVFLLLFAVLGRRRLAGELHQRRRPDGKKVIAYLLVLLICYTLSFIYITLPYGELLSNSYVDLGQDFFNHTGLLASLSKGLPAGDLKVSGITLYYHYFQDLMFGMCENIFGIPAFDLVMQCTPLMVSAVFGTALFCLLKGERQPYRKRDIVYTVCRCCFFFVFGGAWSLPLTGAGYQEGYWSWSNYHIFTSVNAGAFGLAALIAVLIFVKNAELDKTAPGQTASLTVLTAVATGAKGPFSVVFVASFVAVYLVKVIVERNIYKALAC
ncbi:MAG: hypothetical protein VB023_07040 [Oscillibacter sp.]|nr:hypothetical protein [Oscillibacter sp.]